MESGSSDAALNFAVTLRDIDVIRHDQQLISPLILLVLADKDREAAMAKMIRTQNVQVVTQDSEDLTPRLVYSDLDEVTDKYGQRQIRLIFDDPTKSVDKAVAMILLVYRSLEAWDPSSSNHQ